MQKNKINLKQGDNFINIIKYIKEGISKKFGNKWFMWDTAQGVYFASSGVHNTLQEFVKAGTKRVNIKREGQGKETRYTVIPASPVVQEMIKKQQQIEKEKECEQIGDDLIQEEKEEKRDKIFYDKEIRDIRTRIANTLLMHNGVFERKIADDMFKWILEKNKSDK